MATCAGPHAARMMGADGGRAATGQPIEGRAGASQRVGAMRGRERVVMGAAYDAGGRTMGALGGDPAGRRYGGGATGW